MVTLLFTDIEGSTQLWEHYPQAMPSALARHDALLRRSVEAHGGVVFKSTGDGLHAAFARAPGALAAALAAQRALHAEPWGPAGPLRVRMAIHTGVAEQRDGDYFGRPLNRAARLLAAGHGGQVLISGVTEELVREELPSEVGMRSLGAHRLKDLTYPEHIFQLIAADLPDTFPALRTLSAHQTNLPLQPTPLIGRDREVAEVRDRLRQADLRLLTLTGPGGIGKTRLALQVAADMLDDFADGVFFVNLAPIADVHLVACSIAQVLGVCEAGGQPMLARLQGELRAKQLLLVLDNFEQIAPAAPLIAELVAACAHVKVLVTSRQVLHLRGEKEFPVSPLALPDLAQVSSAAALSQYAAVALFIQRAQDLKPDFLITDETAAAIAAICRRLDGLPLAIELAAGWIKLLPPPALLARLERRLPFLTGGAQDLPARQQTLRATIAWSYDLLDAEAQRLFQRLAVFVGGCTLEAAEAVCGGWGAAATPISQLPTPILNGVAALVDKSLLRHIEGTGGAPRFVMLETIHEYALERLAEHGAIESAQRQHASWYLALAQAAISALTGPQQQEWLDRLEQEHSNLRAAIQWALDQREVEMALHFCAALWKFWQFHSHFGAGGRWMDAVLAQSAAIRSQLRAQVLCGAGWLAFSEGDAVKAQARFDESLALARELGDSSTAAMALHGVGQIVELQGDYALARAHYQESLTLFRDLGNTEEIAWSLHHLGKLACEQGDNDRATALFQECLALFREVGHSWGIALALRHLGYIAYIRGDLAQATAQYQEALALLQDLGDKANSAVMLADLSQIASQQGDHARATALMLESLKLDQDLGDTEAMGWCVAELARLATTCFPPELAARFFGAAQALLAARGIQLGPSERADWERCVAAVQAQLDQAAFAAAWGAGRAMSLEQAMAGGPEGSAAASSLPARPLHSPP
jgi:predicted ATPase/class 3 adenylate cyclase